MRSACFIIWSPRRKLPATGRKILWIDGRPYWTGVQMDETAFPILLLDLLRREAAPGLGKLERWWPMVRNAASFILRNGPVTQQDRWEEDAGYSPFTLAAEISALLAAAEIAELTGHSDAVSTLRDAADAWNDNIERWVYATGGDLAQQVGVEGYYVRIAPPDSDGAASPTQGFVPIKNRPPGETQTQAFHIVSPDALASGALRTARAGRSSHSEYDSGHRCSAAGATAARPMLVPLQRRRLRRTQRWIGI